MYHCSGSFLRRPRTWTSMALYNFTAKLQLPTRFLVEQWKVTKALSYMLVRDSSDPMVKSVRPDLPPGKKIGSDRGYKEDRGQVITQN